MPNTDAATALKKAARLRTLCRRLPHLPTPAEIELPRRFEAIAAAPYLATAADVEALVAGWQRWWREHRLDELRAMVKQTSHGLIETDRRLAALALAAISHG